MIYKGKRKQQCGLFYIFLPSMHDMNIREIPMPIKTCDYDLEIVNALASVTLTQTYINPTDKFLELVYSFPINPKTCIYKFVAQFKTVRVQGIIMEKEAAKEEYTKSVIIGKQAALGIFDNDKEHMIMKIGNIGPGEEVKIEIAYMQELSLSFNTFYELMLPASISPQNLLYLTREQIQSQPLKEKYQFTCNFRIKLKTTRKVAFYQSNTHTLNLISQNDTKTQTALRLQETTLHNKNFIFTYTTKEFELPNYVFGRTDHSSSVMLSFIPKFCSLSIDDAYKAALKGQVCEGNIDSAKGEYLFLLDRSGSMMGEPISKAKQALILFVKSLPQDCYFNIVGFGSTSEKIFDQSQRYENETIKEAIQKIEKMDADLMGTEILKPIKNLLKQPLIKGYPKLIFLLTDGAVDQISPIVDIIQKNNKYCRVHTIGIGDLFSQELMIRCAEAGKGHCIQINESEDPSVKIIQLLSDSLSDTITNLQLQFNPDLVQSIIPHPKEIPYYLKGEQVNFYITFKGQLEQKATFLFTYQDSLNKIPIKSEIIIGSEAGNEAFVDKMCHFKRIQLLQQCYANKYNILNYILFDDDFDLKQKIIEESIEHQILCRFTAFLCVGKELKDQKHQEIEEKGKLNFVFKLEDKYSIDQALIKNNPQKRVEAVRQGRRNFQSARCQPQKYSKTRPKDSLQIQQIMRNSNAECFVTQRSSESQNELFHPRFEVDESYLSAKKALKIDQDLRSSSESEEEEEDSSDSESNESEVDSGSIKNQANEELGKKTVKFVISKQGADGSWTDLVIIDQLLGEDTSKSIQNESELDVVITYLVTKWMQKHFPQKQYSLVVKKGMNYVKKYADNYAKFEELYLKFVK